jgi:protein phosphatase
MNQAVSAGLTDIGKRRRINQDTFFLDDRIGLYVVADGMGGHKGGEVASRIVVKTLQDSMATPNTSNGEAPEDESLSPAAGRLMTSIHLANQNVYQASSKDDALQGMGSTVSAVFLCNETIVCANVGDSPIFLIHRDHIDEISEAHTLAAEQAAAAGGDIDTPDLAAHHILTRAIGAENSVEPYVCELQGFPGDILVIGSDGLSNKVTKEEIREAARTMAPLQACRHLIALANERGGEDNITVLITRIKPSKFLNNPVIKRFIHFFRSAFAGFRNKR